MKHTDRSIVVGITGVMGAGKTTVSKVFERMGALRIDADAVGKELLSEDTIKRELTEAFGSGIISQEGRVDTSKLAEVAFRDNSSVRKLRQITDRPLIDRIRQRIAEFRGKYSVIVVDAALLPEWDAKQWIDVMIAVDSPIEMCVQRLTQSGRFRREDVLARMKTQLSRVEKARYSDIIIPNYSTKEELESLARRAFQIVSDMLKRGDDFDRAR